MSRRDLATTGRDGVTSAGAADQTSDGQPIPPRASHRPDVLSIEGLGRRFGARHVIESLTLSLDGGERLALQGPNGSGKTTILRCIAGTVTPTRGRISVGGHAAGTVGARQLIGASLYQERSFYLRLTGHANLLCFARLRCENETKAVEQIGALEEELGIESFSSQRADTYSAGMLQQLAFARALLGEPALLLLDEPTRSLDDKAVERFWRVLDRRPHLAVLLATHNRDDLDHCSDHIDVPT